MLFLFFFLASLSSFAQGIPYMSWNSPPQKQSCRLSASATTLDVAQSLYIKGDLVNVREKPSTKSSILNQLRLGTSVRIKACTKKETIGGKEGCWHPLESIDSKQAQGFLFSTAFSDCRIEVDLDNDGKKEFVYASITGNQEVQLRLHDPNHAPFVFWTTVQKVNNEYSGTLSYVPQEQAGQSLIAVFDDAQDYCGDETKTFFYSYSAERGLKQAMKTHSFSDSPVFDEKSIQFSKDKKATIYSRSSDLEEHIEFEETEEQFVLWQACPQTPLTCGPSSTYEACFAKASQVCTEDYHCSAVAVRRVPDNQHDDFVTYSDVSCTQKNLSTDIHWNLFTKNTNIKEGVLEHSEERCLREGVYQSCIDPKDWKPPSNLYMVEHGTNFILREDADYMLGQEYGRIMTEEELSKNNMSNDEEWWVLPRKGPAFKVGVRKHFIATPKLCGDYAVFYSTELDYDRTDIVLAVLGTPPKTWHTPEHSAHHTKKKATALIKKQLPKQYKSQMQSMHIVEDDSGWHGFVNWCCPDKNNALYQEPTETTEIKYRLPVTLSNSSKITFGDPRADTIDMDMEFLPAIRKDIDGDGIKEVLWEGCRTYWTHEGVQFISDLGDCCGC